MTLDDIGIRKKSSLPNKVISSRDLFHRCPKSTLTFIIIIFSVFESGPRMEEVENAWSVRTGHMFKICGTSKRGELTKHLLSASHKSAILAYANFVKTSGLIDVLLSKTKCSDPGARRSSQ